MDAHLFRLFAKASYPFLAECRIEKIQEPEPGLLTLNLYGHGVKRQLNWSYKRGMPYCFLSSSRLAAQKPPSAQLMRMRKYLSDRRIASCVFQFCQRKLWLLASGGVPGDRKQLPWLCLDMVKGPSLHFLEEGNAPQEDKPEWPEAGKLAEALDNWRSWPVLTPPLRKTLAELEDAERWALMEDLRSGEGCLFLYLKNGESTGQVTRISAWPIDMKPGETLLELGREELLSGFERAGNDLIWRKIHENDQDRLLSPLRKRAARLRGILGKLEQDEKRLRAMAAKESDGAALRDKLWLLDNGSHLAEVKLGDGETARTIALNKKYNLLENMERLFHEAKRGKRGLLMLEERKRELLAQIAALEQNDSQALADSVSFPEDEREKMPRPVSRLEALQARLPRNVQAYCSSDGHIFLRGKDARGNRAILKLAQGHDLWAHVESGQGAHVVIRRKFPGEEPGEQTMNEAASLAAVKSWHREEASCGVMFAEVRHVKAARNGPPGKVLIDRLYRSGVFQIDPEIENKLSRNKLDGNGG